MPQPDRQASTAASNGEDAELQRAADDATGVGSSAASPATPGRERVYMVKRTLVERCFYDPDKIRREFGAPEAGESFEDFVVRVFERFDGSIYGDEFFPGDASPEVYTELEERWEDE